VGLGGLSIAPRLFPNEFNREQIFKEILIESAWGRSLAWIRHQPPELGIAGSNPAGPATFSECAPGSANRSLKDLHRHMILIRGL
jgi:hypothetical protein